MKALAASLLVLTMMIASLLAPSQAQASAFPGANGKIAFASDRTTGAGVNNPEGDFEIFTTNPDGTGLKQLTKNNTADSAPAYSADGKKLVFEGRNSENFQNIFLMNTDGTGRTNLSKSASDDSAPSFSPNGQKVVFQSDRKGNNHIFVMNSDGTGQTDITPGPGLDARKPVFSPDGKKVAFQQIVAANQSVDFQVFVMGADGANPTQLTATAATVDNQEPVFSPDATRIAFASNRSGQGDPNDFDVFVMNADGTNPTALTFSRARDDEPAFSPDGKKVAFTSTRDGGDQDVFVMDAGGANQTGLALDASRDFSPNWQPVGATFTVTTATDLGNGVCDSECTLREAINTSNQIPGLLRNTIRFNIPGSGVQTITPISVLPPITRPVTIDGYTQPGSSPNTLATGDNAVLKVQLNGTNVPGANGLAISGTSGNSLIRGLVINRFGTGVAISGDTVGNRIEGNFIGTDPTGTIDRGNELNAVSIDNGATENVIGGTTPAARNVLSGNGASNVVVVGSNVNKVQGNYIGTDKSGTKSLGNGSHGVFLSGSSGTQIGGSSAGARNILSGNSNSGIFISSGTGIKVLGNRIGTTANGTGALGNDGAGVFLQGSDHAVGDGTSGGSNTIAFNGLDGVLADGAASTGNRISRNSIFSNAGLGIDLSGGFEDASGNTANDAGDEDSGPNGLQNKPVLTSAKNSSTKTTITGTTNGGREATYLIQFFSSPSGNEGKKFIGQKSVTTSTAGNASFTFSPATVVAAGQTVTATATDASGNTSEFSAPRTVALSTGSDPSPETTKLSGPSGVTRSPSAHFRFESPDPEATFECSLDGGEYYECSSPENINRLSEGRHFFAVRAQDGEGNVDPSPATWIWAVGRSR
jgi:CSLREA domain-containing protein